MTEKLLPCPFCGGEAKITARDVEPQGDPWYGKNIQTFVICTNCGACLFDEYFHDGFTDEREAIAAWNRRTGKDINVATNADRIRSMSDEELQKFLHEFESGDVDYAKTFCDLCCKDAALEQRSTDCEGCLLWWLKNDATLPQGINWLQQPAETEGTEI